jgi:hypothetical protein
MPNGPESIKAKAIHLPISNEASETDFTMLTVTIKRSISLIIERDLAARRPAGLPGRSGTATIVRKDLAAFVPLKKVLPFELRPP